jgi:hypothetical protein
MLLNYMLVISLNLSAYSLGRYLFPVLILQIDACLRTNRHLPLSLTSIERHPYLHVLVVIRWINIAFPHRTDLPVAAPVLFLTLATAIDIYSTSEFDCSIP